MNFFHCQVARENGLRLIHEGFSLRLPEPLAADLGERAGQEVIFGIRPENVRTGKVPEGGSWLGPVEARVDVVEPMGSEYFVYLNTGGKTFVCRTAEFDGAGIGDQISVYFDIKAAHFFDAQTEQRISVREV
jgi:multiple sugar transport system ATP-binding protein